MRQRPHRSGLIVALSLIAALGLTGEAAAANQTENQTVLPAPEAVDDATPFPFEIGGRFTLVDHTGTPRSDADFRGSYMLVFFGYASCRAICPVGLERMAAALDRLGDEGDRVQPLFITVDPEFDTPASIAAYVRRVHPRLVGLTGTPEQLSQAARAYRVEARPIARAPDGRVIMSHGSYFYLMGPDGAFLTLMPPAMDSETMAATIKRYLL